MYARIPGTIGEGSLPEIACDTYHHWEKDIELAKEMNVQSLRFSFSWSRVMPEGRGEINQKGLDF